MDKLNDLCIPCEVPKVIPSIDPELVLGDLCPQPEEETVIPLDINKPIIVREEIENKNLRGVITDFLANKRCRQI